MGDKENLKNQDWLSSRSMGDRICSPGQPSLISLVWGITSKVVLLTFMNTQAKILPQNWNYSLNYIGTFQNLNSYNAINTYLTKGKTPLMWDLIAYKNVEKLVYTPRVLYPIIYNAIDIFYYFFFKKNLTRNLVQLFKKLSFLFWFNERFNIF